VVLFYLSWAAPVVALIALGWFWGRLPPPVRAVTAMAIVVQLAMNATMLRDPLDLRVRDVVAPLAVILAFAARLGAVPQARMLRWAGGSAAAALLAGTLGAAAALGPAREHFAEARLFDGPRGIGERRQELLNEFHVPADRTGAISDAYRTVVSYLRSCTPAHARIFALTFAPELFFYSGRGFAGGMVTLTPGNYVTARHATLMLERLGRDDVPLVLLDSETEQEIRTGYPRVAGYLNEAYRRVGSFPISGEKRFIVLAENDRTPVGTFGDAQLPCYADARAE
jgi:hypothetical protein